MKRSLSFRYRVADIIQAWRTELKDRLFRLELIIMPGLFFVYSSITQHLGNYIETRKGARLDDNLLSLFPRFDFSPQVFLLLYTSLFLFVIAHLKNPRIILRLIEMHFMVAIVRQVCILMVVLEPPAGIIVLRDVFLENTVYPHNVPMTKDLFFSGHVASIWIYVLLSQRKWLKLYLAFATCLMSFMLLSMRTHYTYDVYGALLITSVIYIVFARIRYYRDRSRGELTPALKMSRREE